MFLISVFLEDWLQALLKPIDGSLTCTEDGEARQLQRETTGNKSNYNEGKVKIEGGGGGGGVEDTGGGGGMKVTTKDKLKGRPCQLEGNNCPPP